MWWKSKSSLLVLALLMSAAAACGQKDEQGAVPQPEQPELMLDIQFPKTLSRKKRRDYKKRIDIYRFFFNGNFAEIEKDVERKQYRRYIFSKIPYDSNLRIRVEALSINNLVKICSGETHVNFHEKKSDKILIVLRCV